MTTPIDNIQGRKGGRGIRPWLLIPKVLAVAVYLGGLAAVAMIWWFSDVAGARFDDPRRKIVLELISLLMTRLVVPALLLAIILGVVLLLQHPREFLRMRWLRIKLLALIVLIPAAHLYCRAQFLTLKDHALDPAEHASAGARFTIGLMLSVSAFAIVVAMARLKPRLGTPVASRR